MYRRIAQTVRSEHVGAQLSLYECKRYESPHWSLSPSDVQLGPGLRQRAYRNWSLATYPFFYSSKVFRSLFFEIPTEVHTPHPPLVMYRLL